MKLKDTHKDKLIGGLITIALAILGYYVKGYFEQRSPKSPPQTDNSIQSFDSSSQVVIQSQQNNSNAGVVSNEYIGTKNITQFKTPKGQIKDGVARQETKIENNGGNANTGTVHVTNTGINNGVMANQVLVNPTRVLKEEEKTSLLAAVKSELSKPGGDFHKTVIYVIVPEGHSDPDEISIAADIRSFLIQEGCNVKASSFQLFTPNCNQPNMKYTPNAASMTIVVCLPPK